MKTWLPGEVYNAGKDRKKEEWKRTISRKLNELSYGGNGGFIGRSEEPDGPRETIHVISKNQHQPDCTSCVYVCVCVCACACLHGCISLSPSLQLQLPWQLKWLIQASAAGEKKENMGKRNQKQSTSPSSLPQTVEMVGGGMWIIFLSFSSSIWGCWKFKVGRRRIWENR